MPLPTPDGPVMTKTGGTAPASAAQHARRARRAGAATGRRSSCSARCGTAPAPCSTFTRPYLGTASSMSKTFAVSTYSGGSSSRSWMLTRPALQVALQLRPLRPNRVRPLRAPPSAGQRRSERPRRAWTASWWLAAWAASLHRSPGGQARRRRIRHEPPVEVEPAWRSLDGKSATLQDFFNRFVLCAHGPCGAATRRVAASMGSAASSSATRARRADRGTTRCRHRPDRRPPRAGRERHAPTPRRPCRRSGARRARAPRAPARAPPRGRRAPTGPPVPPPSHGRPGRAGRSPSRAAC